jgi:hypothetical protein
VKYYFLGAVIILCFVIFSLPIFAQWSSYCEDYGGCGSPPPPPPPPAWSSYCEDYGSCAPPPPPAWSSYCEDYGSCAPPSPPPPPPACVPSCGSSCGESDGCGGTCGGICNSGCPAVTDCSSVAKCGDINTCGIPCSKPGCFECSNDNDCTNGAKPFCKTSTNTCVACVSDNDCQDICGSPANEVTINSYCTSSNTCGISLSPTYYCDDTSITSCCKKVYVDGNGAAVGLCQNTGTGYPRLEADGSFTPLYKYVCADPVPRTTVLNAITSEREETSTLLAYGETYSIKLEVTDDDGDLNDPDAAVWVGIGELNAANFNPLTSGGEWLATETDGTFLTRKVSFINTVRTPQYNLFAGWNFIDPLDNMAGKTINEAKNNCNVLEAFIWDTPSQVFNSLSLSTFRFSEDSEIVQLKVTNDCQFNPVDSCGCAGLWSDPTDGKLKCTKMICETFFTFTALEEDWGRPREVRIYAKATDGS